MGPPESGGVWGGVPPRPALAGWPRAHPRHLRGNRRVRRQISALLSLLVATFQIYSQLGIPLAIGIGTMLLAGLTLLPALPAVFGRAAFWPSKTRAGTGQADLWGRVATRIVR